MNHPFVRCEKGLDNPPNRIALKVVLYLQFCRACPGLNAFAVYHLNMVWVLANFVNGYDGDNSAFLRKASTETGKE